MPKQLLLYTSGFGEAEHLVLIFNILLLLKAKRKFSKVLHLTKAKSKTVVKPENKGESTNGICLKYTCQRSLILPIFIERYPSISFLCQSGTKTQYSLRIREYGPDKSPCLDTFHRVNISVGKLLIQNYCKQ